MTYFEMNKIRIGNDRQKKNLLVEFLCTVNGLRPTLFGNKYIGKKMGCLSFFMLIGGSNRTPIPQYFYLIFPNMIVLITRNAHAISFEN